MKLFQRFQQRFCLIRAKFRDIPAFELFPQSCRLAESVVFFIQPLIAYCKACVFLVVAARLGGYCLAFDLAQCCFNLPLFLRRFVKRVFLALKVKRRRVKVFKLFVGVCPFCYVFDIGKEAMPYIGSLPRIFRLHSRNRMTV